MTSKIYYLKAITTFFRNGALILKGEVVEADATAKKQLVDEQKLMKVLSDKELK